MPAARLLLACLVVAFVATGCGSAPAPSLNRSAAPAALAGTAWKAILVGGQPTVPGSEPTATFTADQVQGTTGCNTYGGSYQYAHGTIKFGQLTSTLIGCQGAVSTVEAKFNAVVNGATTVSIDPDGRLVIGGPGGSITFVVAGQPTSSYVGTSPSGEAG